MIKNKDIINCLPLLASVLGNRYGVKVRIGGTSAYTNGNIIQIPALPAECGQTTMTLVKGFIDHEAAHIRFTDFDCFRKINVPVVKNLCNSIEDWRVEKKMSELYPGCKTNLAWLAKHVFLKKDAEEAGQNPALSVLKYVLLSVRSWEVPELSKPLNSIKKGIEIAYPKLIKNMDAILTKVRSDCSDTKAALAYATELADLLRDYGATSQSSANENEAQTRCKAPVNTANDESRQNGEHEQIFTTDSEKKSQGDKNAESESENIQNNGDETQKNCSKLISRADLKVETDNGQNIDKANLNQNQPNNLINSENYTNSVGEDLSALKNLFAKSEEELHNNFGELLAEQLKQNTCEENDSGISVAVCKHKQLESLPLEEKESALKSSNVLRQRLGGLLQAVALKQVTSAKRGRLNTRKLANLVVGNLRVFTKEDICNRQNTAVHILLDASFSMDGKPIMLARQACYAVAKVLSGIKEINPAVTVFPASIEGGVYPILRHGQKLTDRFKVQALGGTPLAPALWWVVQELYSLSETRKMIVVITDGVPENPYAVEGAIKKIGELGIELYGIGIEIQAVKQLFSKSQVIGELTELAPALFKLLQGALLKGGKHEDAC